MKSQAGKKHATQSGNPVNSNNNVKPNSVIAISSKSINRNLNRSLFILSTIILFATGIYLWATYTSSMFRSVDLIKALPVYLLGYGISLFGGHVFIFPIMHWLLKQLGEQEEANTLWQAGFVGLTERAIYTTAIVLGLKEAVAVWLVMKATIQWKSEESKNVSKFYIYLIGNALSLIFGLIGGAIIISLKQ